MITIYLILTVDELKKNSCVEIAKTRSGYFFFQNGHNSLYVHFGKNKVSHSLTVYVCVCVCVCVGEGEV